MSVATEPPPPRTPADRRPIYLGLIALAAILVVALVLGSVTVALRHHHPSATGPLADHAGHEVSAPRDGRREARLDLVGGMGVLTVRSTDLGGDLYRISTPDGSGQAPRVVEQGDSELVSLRAVSGGGPGTLDILLSSAVTWQLRLGGGADEARFDLRNGPVSLVDIASGASSVDLWLPRPSDTVTVRETGGASSFVVHLPPGVPVRARLAGGVGSAVIDGTTRTGLSGGTELSGGDGSAGSGGYDLDAIGGLSVLWVDRY
jgi:hypothetical protein